MSENKPEINLSFFYENQEKPWWMLRCVHREHAYWYSPEGDEFGCFMVLREAEGVAILHLTCLKQVHICVELAGAGSVCKTLTYLAYRSANEPQIMGYVQEMRRELGALQ